MQVRLAVPSQCKPCDHLPTPYLHCACNPRPLCAANMSHTHFAEILRYMLDGVRNSADIEEKTGTRFGGLGDLTAAANTSRMVSSDG
jgi:hypothetical protein